jgi:hypothetical protein
VTELAPFDLTAELGFRPARVVEERHAAVADVAKELGR